jgi:hypothetical protein
MMSVCLYKENGAFMNFHSRTALWRLVSGGLAILPSMGEK